MKIDIEGVKLAAYVATNSPGEPVCLNGPDEADDGFQVQIYLTGRVITGVTVSDETGIVEGAGLVPFDVLTY